MPEFTVGVVVRGKVTAATAEEAVELLCDAVRAGIGEEPRPHEIALAAGGARASDGSPGALRVNEALLQDLEDELTDPPRRDAPVRGVTEVGPGDYVKVFSRWERIVSNSASGAERTPRSWTVRTESGASLGMYDISRYAKAEDLR